MRAVQAHLCFFSLLFSLSTAAPELRHHPLEEWLRQEKRAAAPQYPQCCTLSALDTVATGIRQDLNVLTQSVFEIGFNLQEFINLGLQEKYPAHSCSHLCYAKPGTPSGWYYVRGGQTPHKMYCNMEMYGSPFGATQGWMRAIDFDMRRPQEYCPEGFRLVHQQGQRACAKTVGRGCQSVLFPLHGIPYRRLCGRARAFQVGTNNAFHRFQCASPHCNINQPYLDGISITHHAHPHRRHIWSLAASWTGFRDKHYRAVCPCATGEGTPPPDFVGGNYFCEAGQYWPPKAKFAADDPLWDGEGCGKDEGRCCEAAGLPWFCTDVPGAGPGGVSSEDIEVRVCADQEVKDEDLLWQFLEVYVQ